MPTQEAAPMPRAARPPRMAAATTPPPATVRLGTTRRSIPTNVAPENPLHLRPKSNSTASSSERSIFKRYRGINNDNGGAIMPTPDVLDWDAIISDPRFQNSRRLESRSLWRLMAFALWPGAL